MIEQFVQRVLPGRLVDWMRIPLVVTIRDGVGAGLKFDTHRGSGNYRAGLNELPVQETLAQHLKPGDVFYDIGANTGFFTMIGARLVGAGGQVYAFEPVPENVAIIRHNVQINDFDHVVVTEKAVSSTSEQGQLMLTRHPGGATLIMDNLPPDATGAVAVEMVAIDDLVFGANFKSPTFIKIDVEGAEIDVLRGMERVLHTVRPTLLYEIDDQHEEGFNRKAQACEEFLRAQGYTVTRLPNAYLTMQWLVGHYLGHPG